MDCFGTCFTHAQSCDNVRVPSASGHMLNFRVFAFSRFRVFAFSRFRVFVFGFRVFVFSCLVFAFSRFAAGIPGAEPHISYAQIDFNSTAFCNRVCRTGGRYRYCKLNDLHIIAAATINRYQSCFNQGCHLFLHQSLCCDRSADGFLSLGSFVIVIQADHADKFNRLTKSLLRITAGN